MTCLHANDAEQMLAYEIRNRVWHAPHGPQRTDTDFTPEACVQRIDTQLRADENGKGYRGVIRLREQPDHIIGHLAITSIQRGVRHAGFLGYGLDQAHSGQGLMTEAADAAVKHAFEAINLHRIEVAHRIDNHASARVLAKLGFERDGLARNYIRLNGEWADVILSSLCNPAWQPPGAQSFTMRPLAAPKAYLAPCDIIDFEHPAIAAKAAELRAAHTDPLELAQASFEFVRDEIAHSWDARRGPVTLTASEVLLTGFGYCYAKSHLLAALLRTNGIPAGLCYQRLSVGDTGAPYCLHGLNAVLLPGFGWYRVDARGNKPGVTATFNPPTEQLAFPIKEAAEHDFSQIFASPLPTVIAALQTAPDIFWLHENLPDLDPISTQATKPS